MQNVPQFQEKNQVNLTASPQNVQAAWAFSENMGIMGNFYSRSQSLEGGDEEIKSTNTLFEAGTGYYDHFDDGLTLSGFGGMGVGESAYRYTTPNQSFNERYQTNLFRFFLQGAIGLIAGEDNINAAFSLRYANVSFSNVDTNNMHPQDLGARDLEDLEKGTFSFIEPGLTFRAGFKYIKLHSQLIYSGKLGDRNLNYHPINLNIGLTLNLKAIHDKITGKEEFENAQ